MKKQFLGFAWAGLLLMAGVAHAASVVLPDFAELSEKYSPSVVKIGAVQEGRAAGPEGRGQGEDVPEIFRYFFEESPYNQQPRKRESSGSGFFVSSDGYILTNNHVIDGADELTVWLTDQREYVAEVVGTDPRTDLAILKIDGKGFPALTLADSDDLRVGEWVLAIGSPFNLDYSVTAGIVSAIGRDLGENYVPFIQTDVAINPGNSGGPLLNLDGEVVGINAQIYTRSGGYMGVSFAIPSKLALNVYQQIRDSGSVARGWLGVLIQPLNQDLAESYGLDRAKGALISQVLENSPASKAGFQNGDVILKFDGVEIMHSSELPPVVGSLQPGTKSKAEILRGGKRRTITVTIERLPETPQQRAGIESKSADNQWAVAVKDMTGEETEELGESGVKVISVEDGPARDAGLRVGDVVTMIGDSKVSNVREFERKVASLDEGVAVAVRVVRSGSPMYLPIRIE